MATASPLTSNLRRTLCVAPMLDWTDRHYRYFARLITSHTLLYSEMVTATALNYGDPRRLLSFDVREKPVALQLGGSDTRLLARGAKLAEAFGYDEVNLNVGCPSPRVSKGRFGACLMLEPQLVADCVSSMMATVSLPVTVKTRVGVDEHDSVECLHDFISLVSQAGCRTFIIHARKAWLQGLSPKQNRDIPPLQYDRVVAMKSAFPHLEFILNGGVENLNQAGQFLSSVDGVMIGRAAYHDPYLLAEADRLFFGDAHLVPSRDEVVESLLPYVETQTACGARFHQIGRHLLGLFHGQPGGRAWRRHLSVYGTREGADAGLLIEALAAKNSAASGASQDSSARANVY